MVVDVRKILKMRGIHLQKFLLMWGGGIEFVAAFQSLESIAVICHLFEELSLTILEAFIIRKINIFVTIIRSFS